MPQVRDWTKDYTTSTTGSTITGTLPSYVAGDLLVALVSTDAGGGGTWTPPAGWTAVVSATNSVGAAVFYKPNLSGSESDPQFTWGGSADTYNIYLITISDYNTTTPIRDASGNGGTPGSSKGVNTATSSLARGYMPQATAQLNSLIVYFNVHSATAVPSIIGGPVIGIAGRDGAAHSDAWGWSIASSASLTPSTVEYTNVSAAANIQITLCVDPPASGATVVPAYCAADSSYYVNPIHGTSVFNGDGAPASSAANTTTIYGTSWVVNGITCTFATGTTAALTDYGINTYHSAARLTSTAGSAANIRGCGFTTAIANKFNASGKNILLHTMPATPIALQTTRNVSDKRPGIYFGVSSSASNYKVWAVHGDGSAFKESRTPIVINPSSTTYVQAAGTLDATLINQAVWAVHDGVVASAWAFATMWVLDTVTIAGGISSNRISSIGQIVTAASTGHERMSVLQQGTNQMLALQPIKFGNAGTNPTFIALDAVSIEFPEINNPANKNIFYQSIANFAGLTVSPGTNDRIAITNSTIYSPSKYHLKFSGSFTPSGVNQNHDFTGLSVINAGTIELVSDVNLSGTTFNSCDVLDFTGISSFYVLDAVISEGTGTYALILPSMTSGAASTINTYLKNTNFTSNNRAIKIVSAGTYTFDNLQFNGNTYDIENASSGAVIINNINGSNTSTYINTGGGSVTINNSATLTLTGLVTGSEVHVYRASDSIELAGVESTTGSTFSWDYNADDSTVFITIIKPGYRWIRINSQVLSSSGLTIPIQQQIDYGYSNPA